MPNNVSLIQQNLMDFSGDNGDRARLFDQAFRNIGQQLQQGSVAPPVVAGFTEVLTYGATTRGILQHMAGRVLANANTNDCITVAVGNTAVGGSIEYVGIVYDTISFTIAGSGQVLRVGTTWQCYLSPLTSGPLQYPAGVAVSADYRGVAFIYGTVDQANYVFGFVHNVYNVGPRDQLPNALPAICAQIVTAIGLDDARVVIGGDFNVDPADRYGALDLTAVAAMADDRLLNTTGSHCYDYWMCSPGIFLPVAYISVETRNKGIGLSDHTAVVLQFST